MSSVSVELEVLVIIGLLIIVAVVCCCIAIAVVWKMEQNIQRNHRMMNLEMQAHNDLRNDGMNSIQMMYDPNEYGINRGNRLDTRNRINANAFNGNVMRGNDGATTTTTTITSTVTASPIPPQHPPYVPLPALMAPSAVQPVQPVQPVHNNYQSVPHARVPEVSPTHRTHPMHVYTDRASQHLAGAQQLLFTASGSGGTGGTEITSPKELSQMAGSKDDPIQDIYPTFKTQKNQVQTKPKLESSSSVSNSKPSFSEFLQQMGPEYKVEINGDRLAEMERQSRQVNVDNIRAWMAIKRQQIAHLKQECWRDSRDIRIMNAKKTN